MIRTDNRCGTPNCRCHADPPQPHGPYWQFSVKVNGKTVTRRLSETEARLYQEWIGNDRKLRALITETRQVAAKATELIVKTAEAASDATPQRPSAPRHLSPSRDRHGGPRRPLRQLPQPRQDPIWHHHQRSLSVAQDAQRP